MADIKIADAVLGLIAMAVAWLFKQAIESGKERVGLQKDVERLQKELNDTQKDLNHMERAFQHYLERTGKGAAMVLDSPNPTPPEIRILLKKHVDGSLSAEERQCLISYLRRLKDDTNVSKSERSAAFQLLAAMETMKMIRSA